MAHIVSILLLGREDPQGRFSSLTAGQASLSAGGGLTDKSKV